MIKAISPITNFGKRAAMAALFAGAVSIGAAAANKNSQNTNTTAPTELVSKAGADAMKANALSPQQSNPVPDYHNYKLDSTLRKFGESEDDKAYIENFIKDAYDGKGIYLGSVLMQNQIDLLNLYAFMTGDADFMEKNFDSELGKEIKGFGEEFTKTIIPNEPAITKWTYDTYLPYINKALHFDHKPDAKEVIDRLDSIAGKIGFNRDDIIEYYVYCDGFIQNKIKRQKSTQTFADLAAFKMFMIDRLMLVKAMNSTNLFRESTFSDVTRGVFDYYVKWMEALAPKGLE